MNGWDVEEILEHMRVLEPENGRDLSKRFIPGDKNK